MYRRFLARQGIEKVPYRVRCKPSFVPPVRWAGGGGGEGHLSRLALADELFPVARESGLPAVIGVSPTNRCLALRPVGFTVPVTSR